MKAILFFIILTLNNVCLAQPAHLFKIIKAGKVGYIDQSGKIVVPATFLNGDDFADGLAPVRQNGRFGYINTLGQFVIKPKYDLAVPFHNGIGVAFNSNNAPVFINTSGGRLLPPVYKSLYTIDKYTAVVKTQSGRTGCIDLRTKKLIIDTAFNSIGEFCNNVAVVYKYQAANKDNNDDTPIGVINSHGKLIVPFGRYSAIKPFVDGYALVTVKGKGKDEADGVINTKGQLQFLRPAVKNTYIDGSFHNGLAVINLYKYWLPESKGTTYTTEKAYQGYINLKGKVVYNDTTCNINPFAFGRAFIKKGDADYFMVDTHFKKIGRYTFSEILNHKFANGYAIVKQNDKWGIVDTNGHFVIKPGYDEISNAGVVGGYFFFIRETSNNNNLVGIAALSGKVIIKPVLENFDANGFVNGLIKVTIKGKLAYINKKGAIIWRQSTNKIQPLAPLNIDYMNRDYFRAYSSPDKGTKTEMEGGWAASANFPKKIKAGKFVNNRLTIEIDTNKKAPFGGLFAGYKLFVKNGSGDTVKFSAQDSRLYIKLQAQNSRGIWQDIEHLPSSWCGNSYHTLKLEPKAFWEFTIPKYQGEMKTKIRAELKYLDVKNNKKINLIYSNIIIASVNPGQFWNKQEYIPQGIMDPYVE